MIDEATKKLVDSVVKEDDILEENVTSTPSLMVKGRIQTLKGH